jgi:hypothetical protein
MYAMDEWHVVSLFAFVRMAEELYAINVPRFLDT